MNTMKDNWFSVPKKLDFIEKTAIQRSLKITWISRTVIQPLYRVLKYHLLVFLSVIPWPLARIFSLFSYLIDNCSESSVNVNYHLVLKCWLSLRLSYSYFLTRLTADYSSSNILSVNIAVSLAPTCWFYLQDDTNQVLITWPG